MALNCSVRWAREGQLNPMPQERRLEPSIGFCKLSVIVYGRPEHFNTVGDFLLKCDMYLQDPSGCDRNVRYCNPQSLWALEEGEVRMTQDLNTTETHDFESYRNPSDLLQDLEFEGELLEASDPSALQTPLYS